LEKPGQALSRFAPEAQKSGAMHHDDEGKNDGKCRDHRFM